MKPFAALLAGVLLAAACGESSDSNGTTDDTTGDTSSSVTTSVDRSLDATRPDRNGGSTSIATTASELLLTASTPTIYLTTDSPAACGLQEPAVAVIEATAGSAGGDDDVEIATLADVRARIDRGGQSTVPIEFAVAEDGTWRGVVGPFEATRASTDRTVSIEVAARTHDGERLTDRVELDVKSPERCAEGRTRQRPPRQIEVAMRLDPADGVVVATGRTDCARRPTRLGVRVTARGPVVALSIATTLPDGTRRSQSVDPSAATRIRLGPFAESADMAASTPITATVSAIDAYGRTSTESVTGRLVPPEPCAGEATSTTAAPASSGATLQVTTSPDPAEVWATARGRCPAGPTTLEFSVVAPAGATSVVAEGRTANGQRLRTDLTRVGDRWSGSIGPFDGWADMGDRTRLAIGIVATDGGRTQTRAVPAQLRRPGTCGAATTTTTTAPPRVTITTTTSTTTTSTTTTSTTTTSTTTTTTTTTTPPPPQIVNAGASPNPACVGSSVTIGVRTAGTVDRVGASIGGNRRSLSGGGGTWTTGVDNLPGPGSVTVTVRAEGAGTSASSSFTLQVDTC